MLPFHFQLICAILGLLIQCSTATETLADQDLIAIKQLDGSTTGGLQSVNADPSLPCGSKMTYDHWQNRYYIYSILGMAGWSAFVLTIILMLAGLCYLKQIRVMAENELFQLISSATLRLLAPPDPKPLQSPISMPQPTYYIERTPAVLKSPQPIMPLSPAPSTFSLPTENNVDKTVSPITSGGTSYYPPSAVAFDAQGDRWAPAINQPNF